MHTSYFLFLCVCVVYAHANKQNNNERTCNQEAHEPCGCELWEKWKVVSMEMAAGMGALTGFFSIG